MKWIKCSSMLPATDRLVLTFDELRQVRIHSWSEDQWYDMHGQLSRAKIIYWCELPAGPNCGLCWMEETEKEKLIELISSHRGFMPLPNHICW